MSSNPAAIDDSVLNSGVGCSTSNIQSVAARETFDPDATAIDDPPGSSDTTAIDDSVANSGVVYNAAIDDSLSV